MNLIQTNLLSEEQEKAIRELEQICRENDGLKASAYLSNELNFNPEINCYYFGYEEDQLVSFVSLFMPMPKEAEVAAFTLPEYRHKGYFRLLLNSAKAELKKYGVERFLFVTEPQSEDAAAVLRHYGAAPEYSEYLMTYDPAAHRESPATGSALILEPAPPTAVEEITQLNVLAFHEDYEESRSLVEKSLHSTEMDCYCAALNGKIIGICNANLEEDAISIYGVGIHPEMQGKGYGRQMLGLLLTRLTERGNREITLEVSSTNAAAYHLYSTSGFHIKTQYDYSPQLIQ